MKCKRASPTYIGVANTLELKLNLKLMLALTDKIFPEFFLELARSLVSLARLLVGYSLIPLPAHENKEKNMFFHVSLLYNHRTACIVHRLHNAGVTSESDFLIVHVCTVCTLGYCVTLFNSPSCDQIKVGSGVDGSWI